MHNLQLSEEQAMIAESVRKFVQDSAAPIALEKDEHRQFVAESFAGLAELGLLGVAVAEESGGAGLGMLAFVVAVEEVARGCSSTARMLVTTGALCGRALEGLDAAAELSAEILSGERIAAFVGPDCRVVAREAGDGFVLAGCGDFVTGATEAALLVVCADLAGEPAVFVLDADRAVTEPVLGLGFRSAAPGRVVFSDVAVDGAACVARGAAADAAWTRARIAGDIGASALAVGVAQSAIRLSRSHAAERVAFGKPLLQQQAVAHKLVEAARRTEAARHLTWHAARLADAGEDAAEAASRARLTAIDALLFAADEGIQVHGGYGFTVEYHVERHYRDAKTLEVLEGGTLRLRDALAGSV